MRGFLMLKAYFSLLKATAFAVLMVAATGTAHAEAIGAAESIVNRVMGEGTEGRRTLAAGLAVHRNELIRSEAESAAHLRFSDNSDLRLGASAQIRLDAFVFSGNRNSALNLARGALRFVSGNGPSGSYRITTPVATIGLRGTGVDVVLRQGRAYVVLLHGAADVCSGRFCTTLANRCDYVVAGGGSVSPARPLATNIPTFNQVCRGESCGPAICSASESGQRGGYDPAGNANYGGGGGGNGGSGGSGTGRN